jgi:hypothetical protein
VGGALVVAVLVMVFYPPALSFGATTRDPCPAQPLTLRADHRPDHTVVIGEGWIAVRRRQRWQCIWLDRLDGVEAYCSEGGSRTLYVYDQYGSRATFTSDTLGLARGALHLAVAAAQEAGHIGALSGCAQTMLGSGAFIDRPPPTTPPRNWANRLRPQHLRTAVEARPAFADVWNWTLIAAAAAAVVGGYGLLGYRWEPVLRWWVQPCSDWYPGDVAAGVGLLGGGAVLIGGVVLAIKWTPRRYGFWLAAGGLLLVVAGAVVAGALDSHHLEDQPCPAVSAQAWGSMPGRAV